MAVKIHLSQSPRFQFPRKLWRLCRPRTCRICMNINSRNQCNSHKLYYVQCGAVQAWEFSGFPDFLGHKNPEIITNYAGFSHFDKKYCWNYIIIISFRVSLGSSLSCRVGFLPEETYFFRDTRKKVEETYFFQFCPDKTGRNWTKLEKTVKDVRNAGKK